LCGNGSSTTYRKLEVPRFFVEQPLSVHTHVALPAPVAHHARTVLRLREGDSIVLFNGQGGEYRARLAAARSVGAGALQAEVIGFDPIEREPSLRITLIQAQASSDKLDWVIEKAVEIGIARVIVTGMARSTVRLDEARRARRLQHWRELIIAASCQCGRNRPPAVLTAHSLADALAQTGDATVKWILDPAAPNRLAPAPSGPCEAALVVWPEGGFASDEGDMATHAGYVPISLGPRILRTETAGLVAAAAWLALSGEFSRAGNAREQTPD
jgi:16S rRNA (uracil1498-N3)-methyltransferase